MSLGSGGPRVALAGLGELQCLGGWLLLGDQTCGLESSLGPWWSLRSDGRMAKFFGKNATNKITPNLMSLFFKGSVLVWCRWVLFFFWANGKVLRNNELMIQP